MFITKKKYRTMLEHMVSKEMQLVERNKQLQSRINELEALDTNQVIDHMVSKYECGNTVNFKRKSEPSETVIEVADSF